MPDNHILLLDPFKNLLNTYQMIFEEEKYPFETASNLDEAYRLFEAKRYSVIIIEYFPPMETTEEIIKWVRKNTPETYIIMVTNTTIDEATYEKLFATGLDDLILKPYPPERILVHIKKGLRQRDLLLRKQELEAQFILDPVTSKIHQLIFDSAYFKKCLHQELKRAKRHNHSLSLLLVQIPGKEKVSDVYETLCTELAKVLRRYVREEDIVGRENGNFGILLPETDQSGSHALMRRLINLIQTHPDFQSDKALGPIAQDLSIQAYTYPEMSLIPESLKTVIDDIDKGPTFH